MKTNIPLLPNYYRMTFDGYIYCGFFTEGEFMESYRAVAEQATVPRECLWPIYLMAKQCLNVGGEFWECGVHRGGSAALIARTIKGRTLRLFDTFSGMPETLPVDIAHEKGDFRDTSIEVARTLVGDGAHFHAGLIPASFCGLEQSRIAFAHIDLDIYQSTRDACEFIYPRISQGGVMVFDDYGRPSCPGVRLAVDEFFADKPERPLPGAVSGQAIVFKL